MAATTTPSAEDQELLGGAFNDARYSLLLESKIPVAEISEPLRQTVYSQVGSLLERLKEVPGVHQRRDLLSKAMKPLLERGMGPKSGKAVVAA